MLWCYEMKLPFSLEMVGHMDYNWGTFKQRSQLYLTTAVSIAEMPDKWKIALLLTTARSPAIDSLNIFTYTSLILSEENLPIQRWFSRRLDVCCSWRRTRLRQGCLQQQGMAMGRNSVDFVTDQRWSKTLATKTWARPKIHRQEWKALPYDCGRAKAGKTGCEAAGGWAVGVRAAPNSPHPQAPYCSLYLTAAGPCPGFKPAGKKDKKPTWVMPLLPNVVAWEVRTRSSVSCNSNSCWTGRGVWCPALPSRPDEETERNRDTWP